MAIIKLSKKRVIAQDEDTITIDLPELIGDRIESQKTSIRRKIDYSIILQSRGILKGKQDRFLSHVERIREEWD